MTLIHHTIAIVIAVAILSGCAAHPGPIVDMKGVSVADYKRDLSECESYAAQINTAAGVARGAAAGAAVGGAAGAVVGNPGRGAGLGAVSGGAQSARLNQRERQRVVKNCMRGRGYRVLN